MVVTGSPGTTMRWQPAHPNHAIERVNLTIQFSEPVAMKPWQSLLNEATVAFPKVGFNATSDDVELQLSPLVAGGVAGASGDALAGGVLSRGGMMMGPPSLLSKAGRTFRVLKGAEIHEELSIRRKQFVYGATLYTGWSGLTDRLSALIGSLVNQALKVVSVSQLKLEYWDRFVFDGPLTTVAYGELLRKGSRVLPEFIFATNDLWHSHVGYFDETSMSHRRLVNINIDCLDLGDPATFGAAPVPKRSVGIYTMAQDNLFEKTSPSDADALKVILDDMHSVLKRALADTITDTAIERIALNP